MSIELLLSSGIYVSIKYKMEKIHCWARTAAKVAYMMMYSNRHVADVQYDALFLLKSSVSTLI